MLYVAVLRRLYDLVHVAVSDADVAPYDDADLGILGYFDEVVGRGDIYAPDKTGLACRWAEERKPFPCLMIGDTEHDLACASAAGFDCLLVRGGHTSDADLDALGCRVLSDLFEVKGVLFGAEN